ncbi:putative NOP5 family protein [uncultured archaeon]|nr:putative NOP5 family protein [uncultured archaeon]
MKSQLEFIKLAKQKVKHEFEKFDVYLVQCVRTLDELDDSRSSMYNKLKELVKLNFPELDVSDERMAELYSKFGAREDFEKVELPKGIDINNSFGANFNEGNKQLATNIAKACLALEELRTKLIKFIDKEAETRLKNLSTLLDPSLAARMVTEAGGLERLALMPASTIQVMGAEKALFKHLRTGSRPPKHGIIFQVPMVHNAPLNERGKVARTLAAKISICAKADYFTGHFIADKIVEELKRSLAHGKTKERTE